MRCVVAKRLRLVYGNPAMEARRYVWKSGSATAIGRRREYQDAKKAYYGKG